MKSVMPLTKLARSSGIVLLVMLGSVLATPVAAAAVKAVVVAGLGGTDEYGDAFENNAESIAEGFRSVTSTDDDVLLLSGSAVNRDAILQGIERLGAESGDAFMLVLIGHGSYDSKTWRFNIPGTDVTTEDLVSSMAAVNATQQLVVAATSASGALLNVLSQPGRLVVTATKSPGEINAVRFPDYLATALASTSADIDRNEILTLAEAFRFAEQKTAEYYTERKLLASEHARLRGENAGQFAVARLGALRQANDDPAVAALLQERLVLEKQFHSVRDRKSSMDTADYYAALEPILVAIAKLQQRIDVQTGWVDVNE